MEMGDESIDDFDLTFPENLQEELGYQSDDDEVISKYFDSTGRQIIVTPISDVGNEGTTIEEAKEFVAKKFKTNRNNRLALLETLLVERKPTSIRFDYNHICTFDQNDIIGNNTTAQPLPGNTFPKKSILKHPDDCRANLESDNTNDDSDNDVSQLIKRLFNLCGVSLEYVENIELKEQLERLSIAIATAFNTKEMCLQFVKQKNESHLNEQIRQRDKQISSWKKNFETMMIRINKFEIEEIDNLKVISNELEKNNKKLLETLTEKEETVNALQNKIDKSELTLRESVAQTNQLKLQLQKKESLIVVISERDELLREENEKLLLENSNIKQAIHRLDVKSSTVNEMLEIIEEEKHKIFNQVSELTTKYDHSEIELKKTKRELKKMQNFYSDINFKYIDLSESCSNLKIEKISLQSELTNTSQNYKTLNNQFRNLTIQKNYYYDQIVDLQKKKNLSEITNESLQKKFINFQKKILVLKSLNQKIVNENKNMKRIILKSNKSLRELTTIKCDYALDIIKPRKHVFSFTEKENIRL